MRHRFTCLLAAASALVPAAALAQDPAPSAGTVPAEDRPAVDAQVSGDIVVTARRVSESLSRVPTSIAAFNPEQLVERSIRTDSDLQLVAPGLTIRQTQGNNSLTYSIRGQSADTFSGSPQAVITYLNEVPLTVSGASSFYDLDSIQVLKGPQGTLFGRNATGGAVLFTSAKPTNELAGLIRGRVGNYDLREVEGMLNVPIVDDRVLLRGAFNVIRRDGYIINLLNGEDLGQTKRESGRVSLTIKPTDTIANTTVFQYTHIAGTNTGASYTYSVYAPGQTNNGFALTSSTGFLFGPGLDLVFGPGSYARYLAANPQAFAPGLLAYVDEQRRIGPYRTRHPGEADHRGRDWQLNNTTTFELSDDVSIKNIFGASRSRQRSEQPQLGAPFVTILTTNLVTGESGNEVNVNSISNELQLQGRAGDLTYIAGVYLQNQRTSTFFPQTYFDLRPVLSPQSVTNAFRIRNRTAAAYGQLSYALADGLRVTGGIRYTYEKVKLAQLPRATFTFGAPDQSRSFEDPSWDVGLEYQASPQIFTYLKTRGSFRSGGFNGTAPPVNLDGAQGGNRFDSEHVQDIEGGAKYRGSAFGRPATLNVAVYYQWLQDVQRVEFPDPDGPGGLASIAVTTNVPAERVYGLEADATLAPADFLQIGASGALTRAKFTNGNISLFGNAFRYGPVGDTPRASGTLWAELSAPTDDALGAVSLRGEVYAQTAQYFSNTFDSIGPGTRLPGYALVNARLSWTGIMGSGVSAALFGKNLTKQEYFTGGMTLASALGHNAAAVGEPRTYGLEVSFAF